MIPLKKGAKIQNEYMFLLRCIMATSWIGNIYFRTRPRMKKLDTKTVLQSFELPLGTRAITELAISKCK